MPRHFAELLRTAPALPVRAATLAPRTILYLDITQRPDVAAILASAQQGHNVRVENRWHAIWDTTGLVIALEVGLGLATRPGEPLARFSLLLDTQREHSLDVMVAMEQTGEVTLTSQAPPVSEGAARDPEVTGVVVPIAGGLLQALETTAAEEAELSNHPLTTVLRELLAGRAPTAPLDEFMRRLLPFRVEMTGATPAEAEVVLALDLRTRPDLATLLARGRAAIQRGEPPTVRVDSAWHPVLVSGEPRIIMAFIAHDEQRRRVGEPFTVMFEPLAFAAAQRVSARRTVVLADQANLGPEGMVQGVEVTLTSSMAEAVLQRRELLDTFIAFIPPWYGLDAGQQAIVPHATIESFRGPHWPVTPPPRTERVLTGGRRQLTVSITRPGLTLRNLDHLDEPQILSVLPQGADPTGPRILRCYSPIGYGAALQLNWTLVLQVEPDESGIDGLLKMAETGRLPGTGVAAVVLIGSLFLALTYHHRDAEREGWATTLGLTVPAITGFIGEMSQRGRQSLVMRLLDAVGQPKHVSPWHTLDAIGQGLWTRRGAAIARATMDDPVELLALGILATMGLWQNMPPQIAPGSDIPDLSFATKIAWMRYVARHMESQFPAASEQWMVRPEAPVWSPWPLNEDSSALDPEAGDTLEHIARERLDEAAAGRHQLIGRYAVPVPPEDAGTPPEDQGFYWLNHYRIRSIQLDAMPNGWRYVRVAPGDDVDGVVLAWHPQSVRPPVAWRLVLPVGVQWELHQLLVAFERDMRVASIDQVLFRARTRAIQGRTPSEAPQPVAQPRQAGRRAVQVTPRRKVRVTRLLASTEPVAQPPVVEGEYGSPEQQQAINRRVRDARSIPWGFVRYTQSDRAASEAKRRAFEALPLEERLERFGQPSLPERGVTVRGLSLLPDGSLATEYTIGRTEARTAPQTVIVGGLLSAKLALKLARATTRRKAAEAAGRAGHGDAPAPTDEGEK